MKRLLLFALLFLLPHCGRKLPPKPPPDQEGEERVVLVELFTATWCPNCPNATRPLHRLFEEYGSARLLILEYHPTTQGDPYGTEETKERISWNGMGNAPPYVLFNGMGGILGAPRDMYEEYKEKIEDQLRAKSPLAISLSDSISKDTVWVKAQISAVTMVRNSNLVLHFVLLEDSLHYSAGYDTINRFVVRDMIPDAKGEMISVREGDTVERSRSFIVQSGWEKKQLSLIVFVQDPQSKEILQASMSHLYRALPAYDFIFSVGDTFRTVLTESTAYFSGFLKNVGTEEDSLTIFKVENLPNGWSSLLLFKGLPVSGDTTVFMPLDSQDSLELRVSTSSPPDTGKVLLKVQSQGDISLLRSKTFVVATKETIFPYDFELTAQETLLTVSLGKIAVFHFHLKNIGSQMDSLDLDLPDSLQNLPSGWVASVCDTAGVCYPTPLRIGLLPDESKDNYVVDIATSQNPGTGEATLAVTSVGDLSKKKYIRFRASASLRGGKRRR